MTKEEVLRDLWAASWMSKGLPPSDNDKKYWLENSPGMLERGPQIHYRGQVFPDWESGRAYQFDRMLGWQAGGSDVPPYGIWSNPPRPFHDVPPYPADAGGSTAPGAGSTGASPSSPSSEPPAAQPPPAPDTDLATVLASINERFDRLEHLLNRELTGSGALKLPAVMGGGTRTIHLALRFVTPPNKPGAGA